MALICDRAICVRRYDYSETSQVLALFTREHGLIRVIAKGARRTTKAGASRFDGGLDLLDEGDALFGDRIEKDLNILAEWKLLDGHRDLRGDRRPLYLALYLAEIVGELFEARDPHPAVFDRFSATLRSLGTAARETHGLSLVLDLLGEAGFMPSIGHCIACGQDIAGQARTFYSPARGGVVCHACEKTIPDRRPIDPRLLVLIRAVAEDRQGPPVVTEAQADPLHAMLARHLEHTTGKRSKLIRQLLPKRDGPRPIAPPFPDAAGCRTFGTPNVRNA